MTACAPLRKLLCQLNSVQQAVAISCTTSGGQGTGGKGTVSHGARELRRAVDRAVEQALADALPPAQPVPASIGCGLLDGSIIPREDETVTM
ncbi:MAG: hypothetical protein ACLR4D_00900 [Faecalibacterium sp.]